MAQPTRSFGPAVVILTALATVLAGNDRLAERAQALLADNQPVHALHLLEVSLGADPTHRASLEVRRDALAELLDQAEKNLRNSYEMDWLRYRLRVTNEALAGGRRA